MKIVAIVQARLGSTRLPNKVMRPICGTPIIGLLLKRLSSSEMLDETILAIPEDERNTPLAEYVGSLGYQIFRGSESDVLDRYYRAAQLTKADVIVRISGDCPLVDSAVVDGLIREYISEGYDYITTGMPTTWPDGLDAEAFSFPALEIAWKEAKDAYSREHLAHHIRNNIALKRGNYENETDESARRWVVDEPEDLEVVTGVFEHFHPRLDFGWKEILAFHQEHPEKFQKNQNIPHNEGSTIGKGQKLWRRAKRIIPGGNMLLSKRAELFLPNQWPAYFSKSKGCTVWDLDDNKYTDMSTMSIGTNTLGYGHPEVDEAVRKAIEAGNMSSLNCPEEVYLAERLIELHPWAEMCRFARSGGEANAIAIRIARAATGKDKVAICGYHGWHDWYLSANLGDERNLRDHLLPGLESNGVPQHLQGTVLPFTYNRFDELEAIVNQHDIGTIKMEVSRNRGPEDNFLHKVREIATAKGIVLIFDECSSGFRQTFGGLHQLYGVDPDMALFGKALGNGYAITGVIGRREVMDAAQSTFISSTFWSERIGPSAGLSTLAVMERLKSWEVISETGRQIWRRWRKLADKYQLPLELMGIPAIPAFAFKSENHLAYKTLITQEMLSAGYLAGNVVFASTEHTQDVLDGYFEKLEPIFRLIQECEDGRDVMSLLKGPICHASFARLN